MSDFVLDDVYVYLLERTVRQFRKYAQSALREEGINITGDQWVVVKRISEQPGINQREIASLTYKDPASVTRILDLLEKKEFVKREPVEGDRRTYSLYLTKDGETLVKKIIPLAKKMQKKGLEDVSEKELEAFKGTLNKIYKNFS